MGEQSVGRPGPVGCGGAIGVGAAGSTLEALAARGFRTGFLGLRAREGASLRFVGVFGAMVLVAECSPAALIAWFHAAAVALHRSLTAPFGGTHDALGAAFAAHAKYLLGLAVRAAAYGAS